MSPPLVSRLTGDLIPADDHNDVIKYIESGAYRVNTSALQIQGTEVITTNRDIKPNKIIIPVAGLSFYDSTGTVLLAVLDNDGNFGVKGRRYSL